MQKRRSALHKRPITDQRTRDWYKQTPKWQLLEIAIDLAFGGTNFVENDPLEDVISELQHRGKLLTAQKAYRLVWS